MTQPDTSAPWTGRLRSMPVGGRVMLTGFLIILGAGYLTAVLNIYHRHQLADGVEGMSIDDIRAVYSGLEIREGKPIPSRMLTMIGTEMRQYFRSDADFDVLAGWLKKGGREPELDDGEGKRTPRRVMIRSCLRCHAQTAETEISQRSPFGPDEWDVDYAALSKFVSPTTTAPGDTTRAPPQYRHPPACAGQPHAYVVDSDIHPHRRVALHEGAFSSRAARRSDAPPDDCVAV